MTAENRAAKVLVTGSSGFIGSALVASLRQREIDTHGFDLRPPRWRAQDPKDHQIDLTDGAQVHAALAALRPDIIVHLAARTDISSDSVVKYTANIDGVLQLASAARRIGSVKRILWTSSQLVSRVGRIPAHDTDYDPDTSYGESKVITETIVRSLDGEDIEWSILRPTTVWGPGMSAHYLSLLRYLDRGTYFHAGAAHVLKSYSFIENAVHQIRCLIMAPAEAVHRQTFYRADYIPIDLRGWCDALSAALGARPAPVVPLSLARMLARAGDALNATFMPGFKFNSFRLRNILTPYVFDTRNLQAVAGPLPCDSAEGVRRTARWYRSVVEPALERRP